MNREEIIELTLKGISDSMEIYKKWTGGDWLWEAPEYLITVKIAETIGTIKFLKTGYITLEENVEDSLNLAKAKGSSSEVSRKKGRYDILLWGKNGRPRAIIEVKNNVCSLNKVNKDIQRIIESLKRKELKSTIEFGLIAFYTSTNQKQKMKLKLENMEKYLKENIKEDIAYKIFNKIVTPKHNEDTWASVVILLELKK